MKRYEVELVEMVSERVIGVVDVFDKAKGAKGLYDVFGAHYWLAVYERPDDGLAVHFADYCNIERLREFLTLGVQKGDEVTWMPSTAPWLEQFGEGWKEL